MKLEIKVMSWVLFRRLREALRAEIEKKYKVDSHFCSLSINGKRFDNFTEFELWEEVLELNLSPNRTAVSLIHYITGIISDDIIDDFGSNIFSNLVTNELANKKSSAKMENNYQAIITNIKSINSEAYSGVFK